MDYTRNWLKVLCAIVLNFPNLGCSLTCLGFLTPPANLQLIFSEKRIDVSSASWNRSVDSSTRSTAQHALPAISKQCRHWRGGIAL